MLPKHFIILAIFSALYTVVVTLILYSVLAAFKMDQLSRSIVYPEYEKLKMSINLNKSQIKWKQ